MDGLKDESLSWIDQVEKLRALGPSASRADRKNALNLSQTLITEMINLEACFDPAAIEKVRLAAKGADSHKESAQPKLGPQPEASAQVTLPYILSSNKAKAFINLKKKKVTDLHGTVHRVLDIAISRRLAPKQIEALVDHLIKGNPPEDFDHTQVKRRPKGDKNQTTDETSPTTKEEETDDESSVSKTTTKTKTQKPQKGTGIPGTKFQWLEELLVGVSIVKPALQKAKKGEPLNGIDWLLLIFHTFLAIVKKGWKFIKPGVHEVFRWYHEVSKKAANFIVPHPHSHSSGSRKSKSSSSSTTSLDKPLQTLAHWVVYVALQLVLLDFILSFVPTLRPWLEWPFRWFVHKGLVILPAEAWAYAQDHLVPAVALGVLLALAFGIAFVKKPAQTLVLIAILVLAGYYGRTWSDDLKLPSFFSKPTATVPAPVVASVPEQPKIEKHLTHTSSHSELVQPHVAQLEASQQVGSQAFNGDDEQKALLEQSVATFPFNRVIEPIPVTPDSSIGQLMAVNRVGDIAVESEYSLRIGQSGQKIASVTPSATGLTIAIEGGLPLGGLLGGGSALGFYWEDVQTIWCIAFVPRSQTEGHGLSAPISEQEIGELDTKKGVTYYFVLTATNLNQPLVVRCNTTNNLNHLVSAFEYFIKAAQGKYVPVTVMPYLNQGMVLGDENKIIALWAGSPADQAGLTFKDHVWLLLNRPQADGQGLNVPIPEQGIGIERQESKADLEAALQSLPSGKQTIEVVTGNDWLTARAKESREHNSKLEPKLTAVELTVP